MSLGRGLGFERRDPPLGGGPRSKAENLVRPLDAFVSCLSQGFLFGHWIPWFECRGLGFGHQGLGSGLKRLRYPKDRCSRVEVVDLNSRPSRVVPGVLDLSIRNRGAKPWSWAEVSSSRIETASIGPSSWVKSRGSSSA